MERSTQFGAGRGFLNVVRLTCYGLLKILCVRRSELPISLAGESGVVRCCSSQIDLGRFTLRTWLGGFRSVLVAVGQTMKRSGSCAGLLDDLA